MGGPAKWYRHENWGMVVAGTMVSAGRIVRCGGMAAAICAEHTFNGFRLVPNRVGILVLMFLGKTMTSPEVRFLNFHTGYSMRDLGSSYRTRAVPHSMR